MDTLLQSSHASHSAIRFPEMSFFTSGEQVSSGDLDSFEGLVRVGWELDDLVHGIGIISMLSILQCCRSLPTRGIVRALVGLLKLSMSTLIGGPLGRRDNEAAKRPGRPDLACLPYSQNHCEVSCIPWSSFCKLFSFPGWLSILAHKAQGSLSHAGSKVVVGSKMALLAYVPVVGNREKGQVTWALASLSFPFP